MKKSPQDNSNNARKKVRNKTQSRNPGPPRLSSAPERDLRLYERIISSTPDLMALIDRNYVFRMVNDAYSRAFAKSREEILGTSVADLVGEDAFGGTTKKCLDRAFAGETFSHEGWFELPAPGRRFLTVTYHPIREEDGQVSHISVDIRDITELKLAEGDRQRVFDVSLDMLCVAGFDGNLKELNPSWTKTLGWTQEELKRRPLQDLVHPEDREATVEAEERLLLRQKITGFENRLLCKDGSHRWISWNSVADINRKEIFSVARDVTEQKQMAEALVFSEKKYRTIFDCAGDSLFVHDFEGRFLDVNRVAWERLGYSREELLARSMIDIDSAESAEKISKILSQIENTREASFETRHFCIDGTALNVWINSRRIEYGAQQAVLSVVRDISDRKKMEEKLRSLATKDPLTGASNRRHFMECVRKELLRSRRYDSPMPVLILDVDYFKIINDSYGHDVGDEVLIAVVNTCLATLRSTDTFGRLGGEEFAAVLAQTDAAGALMTAERLREALAQMTVLTASGPIRLTVSIGVAMAEAHDASVEEVMKRADMALYEAKSKGRNRVVMG
jgi:diguanylate cyclase (GGDEF)-like protein/PAS domain S-box-containing protein